MAGRVMIMTGGTGGHIFPALAVAEELRARGCDVRWMGTKRGLEAKLVPPAGFDIDWVSVSGIRGKGWVSKMLAPLMLMSACLQSFWILLRRRPQVVLGMGGFVAGPGALMTWLLRIPLVIHEQNRIPGTTNRFLARIAGNVLEAFPDTFNSSVRACHTGNPLRAEIVNLAGGERPRHTGPLRVLVLGGSQGAMILNQVVPAALANVGDAVEVLHQCGQAMVDKTRRAYVQAGVDARVLAFIENMAEVYRWADIAVCRAGAMTVCELAAAGLPSILIPFPYAIDDHQTENGKFLVDAGAAIMIPQSEFEAPRLGEALAQFTHNRQRLTAMGQAAGSLAKLDATQQIAGICLAEVGR
ncbi:MAG: undecaprenyldiphospho-muramoylpentapeptide beta-N-acetylglucosaminyltransferase [Pseudomonadota bacterium]